MTAAFQDKLIKLNKKLTNEIKTQHSECEQLVSTCTPTESGVSLRIPTTEIF